MAMQSDRGGGSISALDIAKDWLSETLASGPMPADEVFDRAKADKIATKTLQRASRALGIQKVKLGMADGWSWSLPPKMAKSAEDAQVSDVATFEEVGHLREIGGSKAPQGPSNRIDLCAQCGRNEWRRDGAAWVCAGCEIPARKSERVGEGVSEVDCAPQDEQPMSPVEPTE
jgi:hypothetical protein